MVVKLYLPKVCVILTRAKCSQSVIYYTKWPILSMCSVQLLTQICNQDLCGSFHLLSAEQEFETHLKDCNCAFNVKAGGDAT